METTTLTSFHHTHILYNRGDVVGKLLALASLIPIFLVVSYVTLIASRREILVVAIFGGQLLCEGVNLILKYSVKEPRPTPGLGRGFGWPSSHAQFMSFWASYILLHLWTRIHASNKVKVALSVICCGLAVTVAYSRIYLGYHTSQQVTHGFAYGVGFGCVWHIFVRLALSPSFNRLTRSRVGRLLLIRDSGPVEGVWEKEYELSLMATSLSRQPLSHSQSGQDKSRKKKS